MPRNGIECDKHGRFEFKDAKWEADEIGGTWTWLCPVCETVVGMDPYNPPADTPMRAAVEPVERFGGPGIPGRGVAGQEQAVLAEYGGF